MFDPDNKKQTIHIEGRYQQRVRELAEAEKETDMRAEEIKAEAMAAAAQAALLMANAKRAGGCPAETAAQRWAKQRRRQMAHGSKKITYHCPKCGAQNGYQLTHPWSAHRQDATCTCPGCLMVHTVSVTGADSNYPVVNIEFHRSDIVTAA